ncbi:MAG: DNA mismatch repair protein MutS [Leptolinea sp.]|jgi:DNA mismatch repair protein MutS|nr:DNA mismatch repair protein MutS [Leptolinea sp.]
MSEDVTPIRQQYLDIKKKYPDAILFFRLGDFYETFDSDAEITSRELDIVLTSRNVAKGVRIPMAGIPYHAAENYLSRLIERGYHVAICEQVGDQPVKGLFPREVTRVVTPGTLLEPSLLKGDQNNYLASVYVGHDAAGLAYADISTGEFATTECGGQDMLSRLRAEMARLQPSEVILPADCPVKEQIAYHKTALPVWHFETGRSQETLKKQFQTSTLDGFGLRGMPAAVQAAGALLQYLQDTQPSALQLLTSIHTYQMDSSMLLDVSTRRNLELTETIRGGTVDGSLLSILDNTITPMGHRLMRSWVSKPLLDIPAIQKRQTCVTWFVENGLIRREFKEALRAISDLERLVNRVTAGTAQPRDLTAIRANLHALPGLSSILNNPDQAVQSILNELDHCPNELALLEEAIGDEPPATLQNTGVIRPGYSPELDNIIQSSRDAREWIANLEQVERERTGIKNLKVGYNKVFGYYIEITHSHTGVVPDEYIRKQTLVNAERYITPEMKEYETLVLNAEERIREVEGRIFREVCRTIASGGTKLIKTAQAIAELDVLSALAEIAVTNHYVCPQISVEPVLEIIDGRHPVVERTLIGDRFIPNDTVFDVGEVVRVITGPNMSGKSTFLRQVALIVLMAQMGSFVPASSARIGLVDRIFTRIGAQDEIHAGQSTFMVEMVETANILHHATARSLLVLDEIGRGTSTYDGLSIAWAVVEHIHNHPELRSRTLFATHYHELTQLADLLPGVRNYNVAVTEVDNTVVFLHKIVPGGTDRSYGIHVGQLAGLPKPVIQRANEILGDLEASSGKAVDISETTSKQMALFPETNPLLDELRELDILSISPLEALNKLFEWKKKFVDDGKDGKTKKA